jgi:hypothetical protein
MLKNRGQAGIPPDENLLTGFLIVKTRQKGDGESLNLEQ